MTLRRYASVYDAGPLNSRLRTRLERAINQAVHSPTRAMPTLRRAVVVAARELKMKDLPEDRVSELLGGLVEDVVRGCALETRSLVSGQPRWLDVRTKVMQWAMEAPREVDA